MDNAVPGHGARYLYETSHVYDHQQPLAFLELVAELCFSLFQIIYTNNDVVDCCQHHALSSVISHVGAGVVWRRVGTLASPSPPCSQPIRHVSSTLVCVPVRVLHACL